VGDNPYLQLYRDLKTLGIGYERVPLSAALNEYAVRTGKSFLEGVFASPWTFQTLGIGKTVYSLKVATRVYGSWDVAKQYVVFMPQDFLAVFDRAVKEGRTVRLIVWDDAGVWIGRMRWLDKYVKAVKEFLNAIRTHCHHIIFTAPAAGELVRGVREQLNLYTFITPYSESPPRSEAAYVLKPFLDHYLKRKAVDHMAYYIFTRHFEHYPEYEQMRRKYVEIGLARMRVALEEIVKEIKGIADYINDTYKEIVVASSEEEEGEDFIKEYRLGSRLGF